jgi:hypothetical protein
VRAYDWGTVSADIADAFDVEAKEAAQRAQQKQPRSVSEAEACDMLFKAHKARAGGYVVDLYQKEAMVRLIMKGLAVDEAYGAVSK